MIRFVGSPVITRGVLGVIDDREYLIDIGQRDNQRMVFPGVLVRELPSLFAFAGRGHERTVHVD